MHVVNSGYLPSLHTKEPFEKQEQGNLDHMKMKSASHSEYLNEKCNVLMEGGSVGKASVSFSLAIAKERQSKNTLCHFCLPQFLKIEHRVHTSSQ